jgi:hypothetical protein
MNGFPERTLEVADGKRLVKERDMLAAFPATMIRTVREGLRRLELPAALRADKTGQDRKIRPAAGAEKRNLRISHRRIAVGTACRKQDIEQASEEVHISSRELAGEGDDSRSKNRHVCYTIRLDPVISGGC